MNQEKILKPLKGGPMLLVLLLGLFVALGLFIVAGLQITNGNDTLGVILIVVGIILIIAFAFLIPGLKIVRPNEAMVLLFFGKYHGTIKSAGFYWVNPFARPFSNSGPETAPAGDAVTINFAAIAGANKVSLKAHSYENNMQKVHDAVGNPIEIAVVLIWRVIDTYKACFDVNDYAAYISTQADAGTRQVVGQFPFDSENDDEKSLRTSSAEVSEMLKDDLQHRVEVAGIEVLEVRISHLAYAKEIAAVMLQRQQAAAVVAAKQKIAEGAVGIVETTLAKLAEKQIVKLSDEKKQEIVSNLLVILCSSREAQPTVSISSND